MSAIDILKEALFGNPPSPTTEPSREGVLAAFEGIVADATAAVAPYIDDASASAQSASAAAAIVGTLSTYPTALPYRALTIAGGVGTGGTPGKYAITSDGTLPGLKAWLIVPATGSSYCEIEEGGLSTSSAVPVLTLPTVTGLTGATAPAVTVGAILSGETFWAPSQDGSFTQLWGNNAGVLATAPFGQTQLSISTAAYLALLQQQLNAALDKVGSTTYGTVITAPAGGMVVGTNGAPAGNMHIAPAANFAALGNSNGTLQSFSVDVLTAGTGTLLLFENVAGTFTIVAAYPVTLAAGLTVFTPANLPAMASQRTKRRYCLGFWSSSSGGAALAYNSTGGSNILVAESSVAVGNTYTGLTLTSAAVSLAATSSNPTNSLEARTQVVEHGVAVNTNGLAQLLSTQAIGRAAGTTLVSGGGGAASTFIFASPATLTGIIQQIRMFNMLANGGSVSLGTYTLSGGTFTLVQSQALTVPPGTGLLTLPAALAVSAGQYVGLSMSAGMIAYLASTAGDSGGYYQSTATGLQTSFAAGTLTTNVQIQFGFDLIGNAQGATLPTTLASLQQQIALLQGSFTAAEQAIYSGVITGSFTGPSNGFLAWGFCIDSGTQAPATAYDAVAISLQPSAGVVNFRLRAYLGSTSASGIDTYFPVAGDTQIGSDVLVSLASTGIAAGSFGTVTFPISFTLASGQSVKLKVDAIDASGNRQVLGIANGPTQATQHQRGWYASSGGDGTAISAGAGAAPAASLLATRYVAQGGAGSTPDLLFQPTLTFTMASALVASVTGTATKNAVSSSVSGSITFPAAASGKDRVDLIVMDRLTYALSRVAGTERTAQVDSLEYMGAVPAGTMVVGRALVTATSAVIANTTLFRGLIKVGYEAQMDAHIQRNMRAIRRTRGKAMRGSPIILGGYGDSITAQEDPAGSAPPYTANGSTRDRVAFLANYGADTKALVPKFDLGRGVTDNIKIGWNWAVKRALDQLAGTALSLYTTGAITSGSNVITGVASTTGLVVGSSVAGAGIPTGSYVTAISGSSVTISVNATATASAAPILFSGDGSTVTYLNFGVASTTSANSQGTGSLAGRDNGLWPARIAVPLASSLDLVVICFGMNERGSTATYGNLVNMAGQFIGVGTEVAFLGCPRPNSTVAANSTTNWRYTEDAIEAAAADSGAAYISTAAMADDRNIGAMGVPAEALGATNIAAAGNHPGTYEHGQYGRACVLQLGL